MVVKYENKYFNDFFKLMNSYKKDIGEEKISEQDFKKIIEAIKNNKITFFFLKVGDKIIGMCSLSEIFSTFSCNNIWIFEDFYIDIKYRKKGYARKLLKKVYEEAKLKDIKSIWVGCCDDDIKMYKSLGFNIELGNLLTWSNY